MRQRRQGINVKRLDIELEAKLNRELSAKRYSINRCRKMALGKKAARSLSHAMLQFISRTMAPILDRIGFDTRFKKDKDLAVKTTAELFLNLWSRAVPLVKSETAKITPADTTDAMLQVLIISFVKVDYVCGTEDLKCK
jgi:hypothetical protein